MWVLYTAVRQRRVRNVINDSEIRGKDEPFATPPSEITLHLAYGEAAVMLIESLMLVLIERGVLTTQELLDAVEGAIDTKRQLAADGVHPEVSAIAAGVLNTMANSLAAAKPRL
jgi:hypothetical protein